MAIAAEVLGVLGKVGVKGVTKVKCRVIDKNSQRVLVRMVSGPIKKGDIIMLKEVELDTETKSQRR